MKKSESQAIHFHPFTVSQDAKKKEVTLFVYILAILRLGLEEQMAKKCKPAVEIALRTLYQTLAEASDDTDLYQLIAQAKHSPQNSNAALQQIFGSLENKLNQYSSNKASVSRNNDENKNPNKIRSFQFFSPKPAESLQEKLIEKQNNKADDGGSNNDGTYNPPEFK